MTLHGKVRCFADKTSRVIERHRQMPGTTSPRASTGEVPAVLYAGSLDQAIREAEPFISITILTFMQWRSPDKQVVD